MARTKLLFPTQVIAIASLLLSGCLLDFGRDEARDPAGNGGLPEPDPEPDPEPEPEPEGGPLTVTVSGVVTDWESGLPLEGADVDLKEGWKGDEPSGLSPASLVTDVDGRFGPVDLEVLDFTSSTFILLLEVTGEALAPTVSDERVKCSWSGGQRYECEAIEHSISVASETLADNWRADLRGRGVSDIDERGLVLFEFREQDSAPAVGVAAEFLALSQDPPVETTVAYLADNGVDLAPEVVGETTGSGLALLTAGDTVALAVGRRGDDDTWAVFVLATPGWIFIEDKTLAPSTAL